MDEDRDYRLLREALNTRETEHKHWTTQDYANALFRDDKGLNGYPIFEGFRRRSPCRRAPGQNTRAVLGDRGSTPILPMRR